MCIMKYVGGECFEDFQTYHMQEQFEKTNDKRLLPCQKLHKYE